jgi:hypothetical protein
MPDYSKGKVYKIVVDTEEEYEPYIGSTIETLSNRMSSHRSDYKKWKNCKTKYISSSNLFEKFGIDKCRIILIENYPCSSKDELLARERYWFDNVKNCNKIRPILTEEEIKNIGKITYQRRLELHPEYIKKKYQRQLELHLDYNKEKYQKYKEEYREKKTQKITCECGQIIFRDNLSRHKKTEKHQEKIKIKSPDNI